MAGKFSIEAIFSGRDNLSRVIERMTKNSAAALGRFGAKVRQLDEGINRVISGASRAAVVVGGLGIAAGAGIGYLGKAGADFEEAIAAVGAVSLMTRDQIRDLEAEAIRLGATTKFTATEAANAMELLGRAGFTNNEVIAATPGLLAAAAAEGAELAETASHVSNVLKGMGLATDQTGRVADVLTLASARTNSSISSLGESMKNVAPVARQFGVKFEEAVAAVALLQDVGIDASEAGTATSTMLTKLAQPADEIAAKMQSLGIAFKDAKGNALPFTKVLGQFEKAAKKSGGNMEVIAFFADLVGLRGQKAALNLKEAFESGKFGALTKELDDAAGSAEKMATLRLDSFKGDVELLSSAIDGVRVSLFQTQSGPLRGIVQGMAGWVEQNQKLIQTGFVDYVERAQYAVEVFGAGAREGYGAARDAAAAMLGPLRGVAEALGASRTWPENVRDLGRAFGFLSVVAAGFLVYAGAVKAARVATFAFYLAVNAVRLATMAFNAVVITARTAYTLYAAAWMWWTVAANTATAATWSSRAATIAATLSSKALAAWTALTTAAQTAYTLAIRGGTLALGVNRSATLALTVATRAGAGAAALASASLLPLIVTLAAAAAAVGALMIAWQQWEELKKAAGGSEGVWEGVKSFAEGDGFFEGVDKHLNKQARERFEAEQKAKLTPTAPALETKSPVAGLGFGGDVQSDWSKLSGTGALSSDEIAKLFSSSNLFSASPSPNEGGANAQAERQQAAAVVAERSEAMGGASDARVAELLQQLIEQGERKRSKGELEITVRAPEGTADVRQPKAGDTPIRVRRTGSDAPAAGS